MYRNKNPAETVLHWSKYGKVIRISNPSVHVELDFSAIQLINVLVSENERSSVRFCNLDCGAKGRSGGDLIR